MKIEHPQRAQQDHYDTALQARQSKINPTSPFDRHFDQQRLAAPNELAMAALGASGSVTRRASVRTAARKAR